MGNAGDWATLGAHPVTDRIFRIPLPVPTTSMRAVNVFAIGTGDSLVLIDSGWAHHEARAQLERSLASIGHHLGDVRRFLITHAHQDHYSQALAVRREFGARVSLGLGERDSVGLLVAGGYCPSRANAEQLRQSGAPRLADAWARVQFEQQDGTLWEQPDEWIDDGQTLHFGRDELVAVATPGHTQGHVVFIDYHAGVLYGGDHLLSATTPVVGIEPAPGERPLTDVLDSLRRILALPDLRLLPAHGPALPSTHTRARDLLTHHERRLELCRNAVRTGKYCAHEVARALAWTKDSRHLTDLDDISAVMATLQTRAYLEHLSTTDNVERHVDAGVVSYAAASTSAFIPRTQDGA